MAHVEVLAIPHGLSTNRPWRRRRGRELRSCNGRCNDSADKGARSADAAWAPACLQGCHKQSSPCPLLASAEAVLEALQVSHDVHQLTKSLHV